MPEPKWFDDWSITTSSEEIRVRIPNSKSDLKLIVISHPTIVKDQATQALVTMLDAALTELSTYETLRSKGGEDMTEEEKNRLEELRAKIDLDDSEWDELKALIGKQSEEEKADGAVDDDEKDGDDD